MKKLIALLIVSTALQAQTGEVTMETATIAAESQWQNWTFAGTAIITAAICVLIVSSNTGKAVQD